MIAAVCFICCDYFQSDHIVVACPCGHVFHKHCLLQFLEASLKCPQCGCHTTPMNFIRLLFEVDEDDGDQLEQTKLRKRLSVMSYGLEESKKVKTEAEKLREKLRFLERKFEIVKESRKQLKEENARLKNVLGNQSETLDVRTKDLEDKQDSPVSLQDDIQGLERDKKDPPEVDDSPEEALSKPGFTGKSYWTAAMEVSLLRELVVQNPFKHRLRTKGRGKVWEQVAAALQPLNQAFKTCITLNKRTVRDKYKGLKATMLKLANNKVGDALGIGPKETETQKEIRELVEQLEEMEFNAQLTPTEIEDDEGEKRLVEDDEGEKRLDGAEMQKLILEGFSYTRKRKFEIINKSRKQVNEENAQLRKEDLNHQSGTPDVRTKDSEGMQYSVVSLQDDVGGLERTKKELPEMDEFVEEAFRTPGFTNNSHWTTAMEVCLLRELVAQNPFKHRLRTKGRGKVWEQVATALQPLNQAFKTSITLNKRTVRDKYRVMKAKLKLTNNKEEDGSWMSPGEKETKREIRELVEQLEEMELNAQHIPADIEDDEEEKRLVEDDEKQKRLDGAEIQKLILEGFSKTTKRRSGESSTPRKRRYNSAETFIATERKTGMDQELYREDEMRRRKEERRKQELTERDLRLEFLQEQQMQHQQQMQQQQQQMQQQLLQQQQFMQQQAEQMQSMMMAMVKTNSKKD